MTVCGISPLLMAGNDVQKLSGVLEPQDGHECLIQLGRRSAATYAGGCFRLTLSAKSGARRLKLIIRGFLSPLGWKNVRVEEFDKGLNRIQCGGDKVAGSKHRTIVVSTPVALHLPHGLCAERRSGGFPHQSPSLLIRGLVQGRLIRQHTSALCDGWRVVPEYGVQNLAHADPLRGVH